jgi:translin
MNNLERIAESIRSQLEAKNAARDQALARSRALIRHCANTIKAVHRAEWDDAQSNLTSMREITKEMLDGVRNHPDLYEAGYLQDALKEVSEACILFAIIRGEELPTLETLQVSPGAYLNGMAEAASELRRSILDIIRQDHTGEAERLLDSMDSIYNALMAFDYPDAITGGLRHRVDALRAVLERTRGDLTNSLRQQKLQAALSRLEGQMKIDESQPNS